MFNAKDDRARSETHHSVVSQSTKEDGKIELLVYGSLPMPLGHKIFYEFGGAHDFSIDEVTTRRKSK